MKTHTHKNKGKQPHGIAKPVSWVAHVSAASPSTLTLDPPSCPPPPGSLHPSSPSLPSPPTSPRRLFDEDSMQCAVVAVAADISIRPRHAQLVTNQTFQLVPDTLSWWQTRHFSSPQTRSVADKSDISARPRHAQLLTNQTFQLAPDTLSCWQIRWNGWPEQGVDVSDQEFILRDSGNLRSGTVLLQHSPWSMVLHKRRDVVPHDLIPVSQAGDSTL